MKQSHSYEKCYELLNININCSWEELRKTYRTLVHKWHPDRCVDEKEKTLATDKLKDLNTAYKQLSDYYSKFGTLPLFPAPAKTEEPSSTTEKEDFNFIKAEKVSSAKKQTNLQSIFMFAIVAITMVILYSYLDTIISISISTQLDFSDDYLANKKNVIKNNQHLNKKREIEPQIKYFSYGSTIGEVILIQGPPDKTIEDVWFYGESEIHFKDGLVIKWVRTANNPLKARAILMPDKKKTKDITSNSILSRTLPKSDNLHGLK